MHVLGHLSVEEFLRDYWQKKPVLIRNAWPDFEPLLAADELAGMSMEADIESRLIVENGKSGPWEVHKGPFRESDFRKLPEDKWTLLVQAVDHWVPEAADLLEHFRFIPSWRIDDLMISYAVNGGSVGPHYDQYDVFLLQAEGQREWRIGQMCSEQSPLLKGPKVRILADFEETDRWVLNPGDMLYLPPGLAHYGIAVGECMTYSIGFRAPSAAQLLERTADVILPLLKDDQRYSDADLRPQQYSGEIDELAINRLRRLLTEVLDDDNLLAEVIGQLMTEPKYPDLVPEEDDDLPDWDELAGAFAGQYVMRHEHARFAFHRTGAELQFWYQGETVCLSTECAALVAMLCDHRHYEGDALVAHCRDEEGCHLLQTLWSAGLLCLEENDGDPYS